MTGLLEFLTNYTRPEAQFYIHQCVQFSANTELPGNQEIKQIIKYLKGTTIQCIILKTNP